jgi:hypothetical protein
VRALAAAFTHVISAHLNPTRLDMKCKTVTLPTREPKIVQVTHGSEEGGYLVANDSQATIAVCLTPRAREQFQRPPLARPLPGLHHCLVKVDRWVVSYLPLAADSSGPRLAHQLDRNLAPICLQADAFSFVSGGAWRSCIIVASSLHCAELRRARLIGWTEWHYVAAKTVTGLSNPPFAPAYSTLDAEQTRPTRSGSPWA